MPEELARGKFVRLVKQGRWEWAERTAVSGVVAIVALTPDGKVLMVEQHRIPVSSRVIEFPAGLAGDVDADESLATAAARELEEETGWRAGRLQRLTGGPVSAGMSSEILTFFRAHDLVRVGPGGGEETEDIEVHEVPLDEAHAFIEAKAAAGVMTDPKVYTGLFFLHREAEGSA
ncbi:MAG: NUDIX hydrolase [Myxococcales bacterium]|nr:NUDIX hydrolase [Myxococcales bacterium]